MKNFDSIAQAVWATRDINQKRALLNEAVTQFKYPAKAEKFRREIEKANATKLDFMASNLALNDSDKVI
jgi:hypothetical protein